MQKRRGQITVFILISLVVFSLFILFYFLTKERFYIEKDMAADLADINSFITDCLAQTSENGLIVIGLQGGYYKQPNDFIELSYSYVPIYYSGKNWSMPNIKEIEYGLSKYVNDNIEGCTNNLSLFEKKGFKIYLEEPETLVKIKKNKIQLDLHYPIQIKKGDLMYKVEDFPYPMQINFLDVYDALLQIKEEQDKASNYILMGSLTKIARSRNFQFDVEYFTNGIAVYTLIFNNLMVKGEPYIFLFALKYDWAE